MTFCELLRHLLLKRPESFPTKPPKRQQSLEHTFKETKTVPVSKNVLYRRHNITRNFYFRKVKTTKHIHYIFYQIDSNYKLLNSNLNIERIKIKELKEENYLPNAYRIVYITTQDQFVHI